MRPRDNPKRVKLAILTPEFPIAGAGFITAREASQGTARKVASPLEVMLTDALGNTGRGECMPHPHFHHDIASTAAQIESVRGAIENGTITRANLHDYLPACPARNAVDAALWDLECKQQKKTIWQLTGIEAPESLRTVYTLSVAEPEAMVKQLRDFGSPVGTVKIKLEGDVARDIARITAVHAASPDSNIIVDANAGFKSVADYRRFEAVAVNHGVGMVEQPFLPEHDNWLTGFEHRVPIFADESMQTEADLSRLKGKFEGVNVKLDKTGGLTQALRTVAAAKSHGMQVMVGTMLASSLSMAPAYVLASLGKDTVYAVDIDSPLLLAKDRPHALAASEDRLSAPKPQLWGGATRVRYPSIGLPSL